MKITDFGATIVFSSESTIEVPISTFYPLVK